MTGILKMVVVGALGVQVAGPVLAQAPAAAPVQVLPATRADQKPEPVPPDSRTPPAAPATQPPGINAAAGDYVLSTADTLEMTIFREADLTTRSRVGSDGTVQLPLIGDIKVAGLTIRQAREIIRKRYDADYLVDPQVYLNVIDFAQRKFTILGQVAKPGTYEFPGGKTLSLLQAIGTAGGFTRTADRSKVLVKRAGKGDTEEVIKVNAKKMAGEGKGSFEVTPGDVITVGESWF